MSRGLPPETIDRIFELIGAGLAQGAVALELGLTKNQVAGIVFRARIAQGHVVRPRGERSAPVFRPRRRPAKITEPAAAVPSGAAGAPSTPSPVPAPAATIVRRETGQARTFTARACQWIDGEPSADDACKCGEPTMPGVSYCAPHFKRAYQVRRVRSDVTPPVAIDELNRRRVERLNAALGQ